MVDWSEAGNRMFDGEFGFGMGVLNLAIERSELHELRPGLAFVATRGVVGNVTVLETSEGLVMWDTGGPETANWIFEAVRGWSDAPVHTIILTHGHIDHVMGAPLWDAEADRRGRPRPRVIAHRGVPRRFARYQLTAGWNTHINGRQFGFRNFQFPTEFRAPDLLFDDRLTLDIGDVTLHLANAWAETDDHVWTWIPSLQTAVVGDLVIWSGPNCGNPQKVQRSAAGWSAALKEVRALAPALLIPGHGPFLADPVRIDRLLETTVRYLDHLHDGAVLAMNEGLTLDDLVQVVRVPEELTRLPWLAPTYDDPEFVLRNIWRMYGGWYDGIPAHLKPPPYGALSRELADLAGGARALAARARALQAAGDLRLAGELVEMARRAGPADREVESAYHAINAARAGAETSLMAKGVFGQAARTARPPMT